MFIVSAISSFETGSYELPYALTPNMECYPAVNHAQFSPGGSVKRSLAMAA
jgi:hypothetical protein